LLDFSAASSKRLFFFYQAWQSFLYIFFLTFKEKKNPAFLTGKKFKIPYGYGLVKTQSNFLREHLTEKQPLTYFRGNTILPLILLWTCPVLNAFHLCLLIFSSKSSSTVNSTFIVPVVIILAMHINSCINLILLLCTIFLGYAQGISGKEKDGYPL